MTDCPNEERRDRLPLLAHGSLGVAEADRVRAHVSDCAICAAELAILETSRLVLLAGAPRVDVEAIARAVNRDVQRLVIGSTSGLRLEQGAATAAPTAALTVGRSIWRSRRFVAAAASLLIVTSLSVRWGERAPSTDDRAVAPDTAGVLVTASAATYSPADGELSLGDPLVDLSSDDLAALLAELDQVDGTMPIEPTTMRQPIVDSPESR